MQLREVEDPPIQKLLKGGGHVQKAGQVRPLLPHKRLGLVPNILNRVLVRVVWRKPQTGDRPLLLGLPGVHRRQIVSHRCCFVVAGIVPDNGQLRIWVAQAQVEQKVGRRQGIRHAIGYQMRGTGDEIDRAIIRLPFADVADGQRDPRIARPPDVAAGIAPQHEAFVGKEHDPLPAHNLVPVLRDIRGYLGMSGCHEGGVFLGLVAWVCFQLSPAACRRS